ncbi:acyl-CoA dehydrogenase family protein [Pleionea litopenaei]|uniref:Acyl-CoA dehydrogenase family protein n=1 Tax=Pleionea litopenaei TaxID=3070815 RepID=A0AA51X7G6_9GAMM|nr:acyl-CoA dehydrogenase family protein [Pleionea sp. HL-JVS1]WMS88297.1 acyl-CoA dehydrogenase family protein [Pleionea sp. HL-JVS1]
MSKDKLTEFNQQLQWADQFVKEQLIPIEQEIIHADFASVESRLAELRETVKRQGLWAPHMPESVGGTCQSLEALGRLSEVLGQTPIGHYVFGCQAPDAGNMELLAHFGSTEQQQTWLQPLIEGSIRSCFAMTEPDTAGSNPTLLKTRAELVSDQWVINGRKWFTSSADGADVCIVMAVTDEDAAKHQRASMFIVPKSTPGFKIIRNISVMGEPGSGYFSHSEVEFSDCKVPKNALLGGVGEGFALAQTRLGPGRIHHCMRWLGICRRALNIMIDYANKRQVSNRHNLGDMQTIQNWIAESAAEIEAARCLVLKTAEQIERLGFMKAKTQVSMIKYFTANVLQKVLDRSLQTLGALGMTDDTIIAFFFRHERAARIYDGPDEVHKNLVARSLLKNNLYQSSH